MIREPTYRQWWGTTDPYGDGFYDQYIEYGEMSYGCGIEANLEYSYGHEYQTYNERQR